MVCPGPRSWASRTAPARLMPDERPRNKPCLTRTSGRPVSQRYDFRFSDRREGRLEPSAPANSFGCRLKPQRRIQAFMQQAHRRH